MENGQTVQRLEKLFTEFGDKAFALLPNILLALGVLVLGVCMAYLLRFLIRRLIAGIDRFVPTEKMGEGTDWVGVRQPASEWIGNIVFWMSIVVFLTIATEITGLKVVTTWLGGLSTYMPKLLAAALIGFIGFLAATLLRDVVTRTTRSAGFTYAAALGKATHMAILIVTLMITIGQIGIDIQFLTITLLILFASVLTGGALAFGLGAKTIVSNILSSYYLQKNYQVGQNIRISGSEGQIREITPTSVILKTTEGEKMIPAKEFSEVASVKI